MSVVDMPADGAVKVAFVPAVANLSAPTAAELTAGGSVDLSPYIKSDGRVHTINEAVIDAGKLADDEDFQLPGRVTHTWTLTYSRGTTGTEAAFLTLKKGTQGFLVQRIGPPSGQAFASGDLVNVYTITCGEQNEKADKNDIVWIDAQQMFVSGSTARDVTVA